MKRKNTEELSRNKRGSLGWNVEGTKDFKLKQKEHKVKSA